MIRPTLLLALLTPFIYAQTWQPQTSNTTASLRGVSAVTDRIVWASGSAGTYLHTTDAGVTWIAAQVPGAEQLDFRGIRAIDARTVYLMSSGSGDKSRIYKTTDAGEHWTLLFTNPDAKGFFDAVVFRDSKHGMILGDAVDGHMTVFTTDDAGLHWTRRPTPPAGENEGAFAASNSSVARMGKQLWFGTGGPHAARVYHSTNAGKTWAVADTPVRHDASSAGIFSLAFSDARHGMAIGGNYSKDTEAQQNLAITSDGGRTWHQMPGPKGFRSAILWLAEKKAWLVTGTSGSDISTDNGRTWKSFDPGAYNAMSAAPSHAVWAVGPKGRIAILKQ